MYNWKPGSHIKLDPEQTGRIFEKIAVRDGALTPAAVLNEAQKKSSPLHEYFVWDNSEAANRYRLKQAGHLIRCITVKIENVSSEPIITRAYVSLKNNDGDYHAIADVLSDSEKRHRLMQQALDEIEWFQKKYQTLTEIMPAVITIRETIRAELMQPVEA